MTAIVIASMALVSSTVWVAVIFNTTTTTTIIPSAFAQSRKPLPGDDAGRDSLFAKYGIPGHCGKSCDPSRGKGPYHDNTLPGDDAGRDSLFAKYGRPHWPCDNRTLDPEWRKPISDRC